MSDEAFKGNGAVIRALASLLHASYEVEDLGAATKEDRDPWRAQALSARMEYDRLRAALREAREEGHESGHEEQRRAAAEWVEERFGPTNRQDFEFNCPERVPSPQREPREFKKPAPHITSSMLCPTGECGNGVICTGCRIDHEIAKATLLPPQREDGDGKCQFCGGTGRLPGGEPCDACEEWVPRPSPDKETER